MSDRVRELETRSQSTRWRTWQLEARALFGGQDTSWLGSNQINIHQPGEGAGSSMKRLPRALRPPLSYVGPGHHPSKTCPHCCVSSRVLAKSWWAPTRLLSALETPVASGSSGAAQPRWTPGTGAPRAHFYGSFRPSRFQGSLQT